MSYLYCKCKQFISHLDFFEVRSVEPAPLEVLALVERPYPIGTVRSEHVTPGQRRSA